MHALALPDALAPPALLALLLAALFCSAFLNPLRACLALFLVRPDEQGCGLSIPEDQTRLSPPPYRHPPRMGEGMRCFVHHTPPLIPPRWPCSCMRIRIRSLLQFVSFVVLPSGLRLADAVLPPTYHMYHTHARTRPNGTYTSPTIIFLLHPLPSLTALFDVSLAFQCFINKRLAEGRPPALPRPCLNLNPTRSLYPQPSIVLCPAPLPVSHLCDLMSSAQMH